MLRRRASNFFTRKSHSVENYNLTKLRSSTQINSLYGGDTHLAVRSTGCLLDIQDSVLTKKTGTSQELTESNKPPIRTRYLGHVTGYQPIRHQYFLIRSQTKPTSRQGLSALLYGIIMSSEAVFHDPTTKLFLGIITGTPCYILYYFTRELQLLLVTDRAWKNGP